MGAADLVSRAAVEAALSAAWAEQVEQSKLALREERQRSSREKDAMAALLLLFALPVVQCSPVMLNKPHHSAKSVEATHPHPHHTAFYHRYHHWEQQNAALTANDAAKAQADEQRIFEQGRELRAREAEFRKKLDECKQGDQVCHRRVISDEIRQQRMRAMPHRRSNQMEVTDAMGRSMPVLFNGHPEPFHSKAAPAAVTLTLLLTVFIVGLLN